MLTLARFRFGRIFLHVLALAGDGALRFHAGGITRELCGWRKH
jgi:hypothetical protein